ncbi:hypothetical protein [Staphylococcus argenteus]|uniref:Uncharacterized protein n=1 Tax=Staphylococcus argenteus TaxID=985002 RepID=A0A7U7JV36_9STAP|nr:hypothetical protein [Staphylococcus argenteus]BBN29467.1 hypothetical protein KUH140087_0313 [Staphylococcus aureus]API79647.1 hypothetical protein A7971_08105 [Staphylococcus argenteus]ATY57231.1 hypothetical protein CJ017_08185 [Staphylococcus argenteus]ATZ87454.1 hypothetical protein CKO49_08200 [Staphylococcus argenteus]EKF1503975.1 hypothetical protein [Staphylococcus argenteus]
MSDIIQFPNVSQKLLKDIKQAEENRNYEQMYEYIEQYERQFELTEEIAMMKCRMLYETESYLELREEAIVLLKSGIQQYDTLMIYYVKSLIGLNQYFEAIEVINQIIDEVRDHKTRMALYPLKEFAKSKLIEDEKEVTKSLTDFNLLSMREQTNLLLKLIDNGHFQFKETIFYLLESQSHSYNMMSLMIEYLRFANCTQELMIEKYGIKTTIVPANLKGLEHTTLKEQVLPSVMESLENGAIHIAEEAHHIMNNHSILLYPFDIESLFDIESWVNAYECYFKNMLGIESELQNYDTFKFIQQLDLNGNS